MNTDQIAILQAYASRWTSCSEADYETATSAASKVYASLTHPGEKRLSQAQKLYAWRALKSIQSHYEKAPWLARYLPRFFREPDSIREKREALYRQARLDVETIENDLGKSPPSNILASHDRRVRGIARAFYRILTQCEPVQPGAALYGAQSPALQTPQTRLWAEIAKTDPDPEAVARCIIEGADVNLAQPGLRGRLRPLQRVMNRIWQIPRAHWESGHQSRDHRRYEALGKMAEYLVQEGAKTDIRIEAGDLENPLLLALDMAHVPLVLALLRQNAPASTSRKYQLNMWSGSWSEGSENFVKALLYFILRDVHHNSLDQEARRIASLLLNSDQDIPLEMLLRAIPNEILQRHPIAIHEICKRNTNQGKRIREELFSEPGEWGRTVREDPDIHKAYTEDWAVSQPAAIPEAVRPPEDQEEINSRMELIQGEQEQVPPVTYRLKYSTGEEVSIDVATLRLLVEESPLIRAIVNPNDKEEPKEGVRAIPLPQSITPQALEAIQNHLTGEHIIRPTIGFDSDPEKQKKARAIALAIEALQLHSLKSLQITGSSLHVIQRRVS